MKRVGPTPIESFTPAPRQIADDLWIVVRKLRLLSVLRLPTHMTLLRLANGGIVVHAPVHLDPALLAATRAFGNVVAIIAPNSFHYSYIGEWVREFPAARVFYAPGLPTRVPGLPTGTELTDTAPDVWSGEIEQIVFGPIGPFAEVAFRHRRSKTLILCDLAFGVLEYDSAAQRIAWRFMGVPSDFGPSRSVRITLLRDRNAAQPYLQRIAKWEFERIIVAHGGVIEQDGHAIFERGFATYL